MRLYAAICCFSLAVLIAPAPAAKEEAAEPPAQAGTARDIIFRADTAYNNKRYQEAVAGYERFIEDFGSSSESQSFMPHVRYNVAASLLQLQKYADAIDAIDDALKVKEMGATQKEDLLFWKAIALLQSESFEEAVKVLGDFRKAYPESARRQDAELLTGTALLAGDERAEALKYFTDIRTKVKNHPHAGRATVLELHCLIEEGKDEEALDLLAEVGPEMGAKINQLATFQTLALSLGGKFLDEERPRDAIRALQNIW
ncbi:MAG: tetratricopeptide repeat protein, partial [Chthoniobacterales bacterium]